MPRSLVLLTICFGVGKIHFVHSSETCYDGDEFREDCIDGYTSLLQDSLRLHSSKSITSRGGHATTAEHADGSLLELFSNESHSHMTSLKWILFLGVAVLACGTLFYFAAMGAATTVARFNATQGQRALQGGGNLNNVTALQTLVVDVYGENEVEERAHDTLDEDTYSLAIALVVRDLFDVANMEKDNKAKRLKYSRIMFACVLALITSVLEISLVVCTKRFVTPQQVASIRDAYDQFEVTMYANHTYLNKNGKNRGIPGFFDAALFDTIDDDSQGDICNIPLSQLGFIGVVLIVWSITCFSQIKCTIENFMALLFFARTVDSMSEALEEKKEESGDISDDDGPDHKCFVIVGLTLPVKVLLVVFIFLPDLGTASYVLWLGSRWLLATNDFGNLISNAVALEFILQLKCLLFLAMVSDRNKRDLNATGLAPPWAKEPAGYGVYFNSLTWAMLALLWVWAYLFHLQQVLPDYHWDVHAVCTPWLYNQLST